MARKRSPGQWMAVAVLAVLSLASAAAQVSLPPGNSANDLLGLPPGPYSSGVGNTTAPPPDNPIPGFVDGQVNPKILGWAAQVKDYSPANPATIDSYWTNTGNLLQPVTGNVFDVVSLGDLSAADIAKGVAPGSLTLAFAQPVGDGDGPDLVIFGNAFQLAHSTRVFAKLAYVEVSTDGVVFARFPSVDTNPRPAGTSWPYVTSDATKIYNLFGKAVNAYGSSWGNPFDLRDLANNPLVISGAVDLQNIRYLRLVAIPGSGAYQDSLGHPIYCPWPTYGSPGPEVQAVGVLNLGHPVDDNVQTPSTTSASGVGRASGGGGSARSEAAVSPTKGSAKASSLSGGASLDSAFSADSTLGSDIAHSEIPSESAFDAPAQSTPLGDSLPQPSLGQLANGTLIGTGTVAASASAEKSANPAPSVPGASLPTAAYPDKSLTPTGLPVPTGSARPTVWGRTVQRVAYLTGWSPTPSSALFVLIVSSLAIFTALRHRRPDRGPNSRPRG